MSSKLTCELKVTGSVEEILAWLQRPTGVAESVLRDTDDVGVDPEPEPAPKPRGRHKKDEEAPKPKRGRRKKVEKDDVPEDDVPEDDVPEPEDDVPEPEEDVVDREAVKAIVGAAIQAIGLEEVKKIFAKMKAARLAEVPDSSIPKLLSLLEEARGLAD